MKQFLVVGRTGVGKSSFINSVFGQYIAETSEYEACTKMVEYHAYGTSFGDIHLIDTPGFAEEDEATDLRYLSLIRESVDIRAVHSTIYVTRLDETRFRPDEKRTLRLLTQNLGMSIWRNAILVFTFSASVPKNRLDEIFTVRANQIENFLQSLDTNPILDQRFDEFKSCWLIDNEVYEWTFDAEPVSNLFADAISYS